jgi:hypothetical protein
LARLIVYAYDNRTGKGIPGLSVYLFEGSGEIESPEKAEMSGVTDGNGKAVFDAYGFYRVGISDGRFSNADPEQTVPVEWNDVYSAWGACGVTGDMEYEFPLISLRPSMNWLLLGLVGLFAFTGVIGVSELSKKGETYG